MAQRLKAFYLGHHAAYRRVIQIWVINNLIIYYRLVESFHPKLQKFTEMYVCSGYINNHRIMKNVI